MQVQSDIVCITGRASNMFLIEEDHGLVLIDCGMPREKARVASAVADLGYALSDIHTILITHADVDHVGSLAAIQAKSGATVYAGRATADHLIHGTQPQHLPRVMQWLANLAIRLPRISAEIIHIFADGDELPILGGLQVLATPGHTPDHHSFYSPSRGILFAGDAISTRNDTLNPSPKRITADQRQADLSVIKLLELAPAVFACGHGTPMQGHSMDDTMQLFNSVRQDLEAIES